MDDIVVCQTCQRSLNRYADETGTGYLHSLADADDHEPVPVSAPPEWRGRCDFCTTESAAYVLPARDFSAPGLPAHMSYGDWGACDECARLLSTDQWSKLHRRAVAAHERRTGVILGEEQLTMLRALYRALRKHVTGAVRSLDG